MSQRVPPPHTPPEGAAGPGFSSLRPGSIGNAAGNSIEGQGRGRADAPEIQNPKGCGALGGGPRGEQCLTYPPQGPPL